MNYYQEFTNLYLRILNLSAQNSHKPLPCLFNLLNRISIQRNACLYNFSKKSKFVCITLQKI